jgi:hypothetical protein
MDGSCACCGLVLVAWLWRKKILKIYLETVAHVHAQDQRARALIGAQSHLAWLESPCTARRDNMVAQREDHPLRLHRAESIPKEDLI